MSSYKLLIIGVFAFVPLFVECSVKASNILNLQKDSPMLLDQFGVVGSENLEARLDNLVHTLKSEPELKVIVIFYTTEDKTIGYRSRYAAIFKTYVSKVGGLDAERLKFAFGGIRKTPQTQIYALPPNVNLPALSDTSADFTVSKTFLFDSFGLRSPNSEEGCCKVDRFDAEKALASLDTLAAYLKANDKLKAYIIAYGEYCFDCASKTDFGKKGNIVRERPIIFRDSPNIASDILRNQKEHLIKTHSVDLSKIVTINGGFNRYRKVELYLVPENETIPKPKPTTFPPKRKRRAKAKSAK